VRFLQTENPPLGPNDYGCTFRITSPELFAPLADVCRGPGYLWEVWTLDEAGHVLLDANGLPYPKWALGISKHGRISIGHDFPDVLYEPRNTLEIDGWRSGVYLGPRHTPVPDVPSQSLRVAGDVQAGSLTLPEPDPSLIRDCRGWVPIRLAKADGTTAPARIYLAVC
jgi:hypothetical protein